jgi:hypothetical protein
MASQAAEKLRFVSGYRFSDTVISSKSEAPLGAGRRTATFSAACLAMPSEPSTQAALQLAEKVDVAVVFGWRSGLPLR